MPNVQALADNAAAQARNEMQSAATKATQFVEHAVLVAPRLTTPACWLLLVALRGEPQGRPEPDRSLRRGPEGRAGL